MTGPNVLRARWLAVAATLVTGAWLVYRAFDWAAEMGPALAANQFLLPALSLTLVVLVLLLAAVLIRNLVRLILERKRGLLGSRLRTKLVFFFLALVLLPASALFWGSAQLIKTSVEAILRTPLEELTRQSGEIVDHWRDHFEEQAAQAAVALAAEVAATGLSDAGREGALAERITRWQREHPLEFVQFRRGSAIVAEAVQLADPTVRPELDRLADALARESARSATQVRRVDQLGRGLLAQAAVPLGSSGEAGGPAIVLTVGLILPTRLAGNLEGFRAADQAYRQFRVQRRESLRLYLTQIGLIFVAVVFIATWIGFSISRRITGPIQELSAASRAISRGDLRVRVRSAAGDELGLLVEAFNDMAEQLEESRAVINRSTTELQRSNRALDERRRYIETLLAHLSTGVISLDPELRVSTTNPAVSRILGLELALGADPRPALCAAGLEPLAALLSQPRGAEGARQDLTLQRVAGPLHVAVQVTHLADAAGARAGSLLMVEDLTDLLQAQRAAAWREVAQRIAHEIKNPLTPIQLAAQRLRKKHAEGGGDLDRVLPEATASIEREVGALKQLVDEFSRFARMPEIAPAPVDLRGLLASVFALYRGMPGIDWQLEIESAPAQVTVDAQQIRRVLINLIDNSVEAVDGGGTIRVTAAPAGPRWLRLEVADTGPGIPPADRAKLFVPYFSTKRRGTGLGLAIVHKVVTDHRGTIRVEDNEPRGARFVIELPV